MRGARSSSLAAEGLGGFKVAGAEVTHDLGAVAEWPLARPPPAPRQLAVVGGTVTITLALPFKIKRNQKHPGRCSRVMLRINRPTSEDFGAVEVEAAPATVATRPAIAPNNATWYNNLAIKHNNDWQHGALPKTESPPSRSMGRLMRPA